MKRSEWLWALAFLLLLLLGYGFVRLPRRTETTDSFAEDGGGKKAFYLLASELLPDVGRNRESLIPPDPDADTLVMLGPARYPDRAQWQTLYDWLTPGRSLVFAARWEDPAVELEPFGIEIVPLSAEDETPETDSTPTDAGPQGNLLEGEVDWRSNGQIRTVSDEAFVQLAVDGKAQVVWQGVGNGVIVVVSSDFIFTNRSLTLEDNGLLAFRILEAASPYGPVYFDERMNEAGAPRVAGILFEDPFRLLSLQLLIVILLFYWMASRRFGPVASRGPDARRSLVEHAEALGGLHFRAGTGAPLLVSYLELFRRDLGLEHRSTARGTELVQRETADPGRGAPGVVARALRAQKNPNLDRHRVAETIRALSESRKKGK